jgi:parallel beta-helix repeat protein
MNIKLLIIRFLIIIIGISIFPFNCRSGQPPVTGNWIITDKTIIDNKSINLNGDLIVKTNGSLELSNVELTFESTYDGQYSITVKPGGSLSIDSSTISTKDNLFSYNFSVDGDFFILRNSELSNCGWGNNTWNLGSEEEILSGKRGLTVTTNFAKIEGNIISNNYVGLIISGKEIQVDSNHIYSNFVNGIYCHKSSNCNFSKNTIEHGTTSSAFRLVDSDNNKINENKIESSIHNGDLMLMRSSNNIIKGNIISGLGVGILLMSVSSNNEISENSISTDECGVMIWGWNNVVKNNTITNGTEGVHTGIYAIYSYNSSITENKISTITNENGIWLRHSSNNEIISNDIKSLKGDEIDYSSGILLINSSKNNTVWKNVISSFSRGISVLYDSDKNIVAGNELLENKLENVIIDTSDENLVYSNRFLDNENSSFDNGSNS